jgi:hypothetical protein
MPLVHVLPAPTAGNLTQCLRALTGVRLWGLEHGKPIKLIGGLTLGSSSWKAMPVITPATMAMMLQDATMQATKLVAVATSVLTYQDLYAVHH